MISQSDAGERNDARGGLFERDLAAGHVGHGDGGILRGGFGGFHGGLGRLGGSFRRDGLSALSAGGEREQHQGCQCKSKDLFGVHFLNSFSKKYSNNQPSGAKTPPLSRKWRRNRRWIAQLYPVPEALMRKQVSRLGIILLKPFRALRQWYRLFCPLYGYWDSLEFASVFPRRGLPRRRLSTRIHTLFVCGHTISVSSPDVKAAKPALSVFYQKAPVFF